MPFDQNLEWLGGEMITTTKTEYRRAMHCPVLISIVVRILHCQFTISPLSARDRSGTTDLRRVYSG